MTNQQYARERIEEEAALWVVLLQDGRLSARQKRELKEWMSRSPYHEKELRALASFHDSLSEFLHPQYNKTEPLRETRPGTAMRSPLFLLAGALILMVISVLLYDQWGMFVQSENLVAGTYHTEIGQRKDTVLPDGSTANLNTKSKIVFDYSEHARTIHLIEGEVLFSVHPDSKRPFLVLANGGVIRAVGTVFSVRVREQNIEVLVSEGRVALATTIQPKTVHDVKDAVAFEARPLMQLNAGQMARFSDRIETVVNLSPEKMENKLLWRSDMLIFDNEPLQVVVQDISRYTTQKIIISNENLKNIKVSGIFPTGKTSAFLLTLEESFGISVRVVSENQVHLYLSPE